MIELTKEFQKERIPDNFTFIQLLCKSLKLSF